MILDLIIYNKGIQIILGHFLFLNKFHRKMLIYQRILPQKEFLSLLTS